MGVPDGSLPEGWVGGQVDTISAQARIHGGGQKAMSHVPEPEPTPWRPRATLKRLLEKGLTARPARWLLRRRSFGRAVILAYHNVVPAGEPITGASGAHVRGEDFRWQMDLLEEFCSVVPLLDLLDPYRGSGKSQRLRVAITFDDAYTGTLREALPELARRSLPATVFVPTGLVGEGAFWWDDLGVSGWEGAREPLEELRGETQRIRRWAGRKGLECRPQGPSQTAASEEELLRASGLPGMTFGVHTVGHPNLTRLSAFEVRRELEDARSWLLDRDIPFSDCLAYPYGLVSREVVRVARELDFRAGVTITGGWVPKGPVDVFSLPRLNIPAGLTRENFLLRLFGVLSG